MTSNREGILWNLHDRFNRIIGNYSSTNATSQVMTYVYVCICIYIYTCISSHAHLQIDSIEARTKEIYSYNFDIFFSRGIVFVLNFKFRLINIVEI